MQKILSSFYLIEDWFILCIPLREDNVFTEGIASRFLQLNERIDQHP